MEGTTAGGSPLPRQHAMAEGRSERRIRKVLCRLQSSARGAFFSAVRVLSSARGEIFSTARARSSARGAFFSTVRVLSSARGAFFRRFEF